MGKFSLNKTYSSSLDNISGTISETQLDDYNKVIYSITRPNDLENGLWIKNDMKLPLMEVSSWDEYKLDQINVEIENYTQDSNSNMHYYFRSDVNSQRVYISTNKYLIAKDNSFFIVDFGTNTVTSSASVLNASYVNFSTSYSHTKDIINKIIKINNKIYFFGGGSSSSTICTNTCIYDISTDTLTYGASLPNATSSLKVDKWSYNNVDYVILFGGIYYSDSKQFNRSYLYKYDTSSNTCTTLMSKGIVCNGCSYCIYGNYLYTYGYYSSQYRQNPAWNRSAVIDKYSLTSTSTAPVESKNMDTNDIPFGFNANAKNSSNQDMWISNSIRTNGFNLGIIYGGNNDYRYFLMDPSLPNWYRMVNIQEYLVYQNNIKMLSNSMYDLSKYLIQNCDNLYIYNNKITIPVSIYNNSTSKYTIYYIKISCNVTSIYPYSYTKFYPIRIQSSTKQIDKNLLQYKENVDKLDNISNILTFVNNKQYSYIDCITKIYKPNYTGELQEAWKVRDGVWTQLNTDEIPNKLILNNNRYLTGGSSFGHEMFLSYVNSIDNTKIIVPNNITYNSESIYSGSYTYTYLWIRADCICNFDDDTTFDDTYALELFKNVSISGTGFCLGRENSNLISVTALNSNGFKYIQIYIVATSTNSSYYAGCYSIKVLV